MPSFRTHFVVKGSRIDIKVTPVEDNCFVIEKETSDAFDESSDPKKETVASRKEPGMIVQKTKSNEWVILDQKAFELDQKDLKELGKAIENGSLQAF